MKDKYLYMSTFTTTDLPLQIYEKIYNEQQGNFKLSSRNPKDQWA